MQSARQYGGLSARPQLRNIISSSRRVTCKSQHGRARLRSHPDHPNTCQSAAICWQGLQAVKRAAAASPRTVDSRNVVTKAAQVDVPAFNETDIWQWRQAQLWQIAKFTGPALSIPLADPIMSLVDTVCVGRVRIITADVDLGPDFDIIANSA